MRTASFGRSLALLLTSGVIGCAPRPGTVPPSAPIDDGVAWSPFRWVSASIGERTFARGAIFVPITSETLGGTYYLQLDTGADAALWIYRAPLRQLLARRGIAYDSTRAVRLDGRLGALPLRGEPVQVQRYEGDTLQAGDTLPKIGTLGLEFFRDRVLLLDLPGARFAILDSAAALPAWIARGVRWVPAEHRDEKLFIPLTLGDSVYSGFFYDSGASLFALSTTAEVWRRVTGRTGDEPDNVVWRVGSFGQQVVLKGAPVRGRVAVGAASLERPLAFHLAEGPERLDFGSWGFPVTGLVGNALFYDRFVVVVDLPRRRFGLVERPASGPQNQGSSAEGP